MWRRIKTTKKGNEFLAYIQKMVAQSKKTKAKMEPASDKPMGKDASAKKNDLDDRPSTTKPVVHSPAGKATKKKKSLTILHFNQKAQPQLA